MASVDIPSGFAVEKVDCQLYLEDLEEDDELWLVRMPNNIELSTLDKKKIFLSDNCGDTNIKDIKTSDGKLLECYAENCEIPSLCVVIPQKTDGQLHVVKKSFKGTVLISEGLATSDGVEVKSENHESEQTDDSVLCKPSKKKSKKKSGESFNFEASDLNYETEAAETFNPVGSMRKKSKKHRKRAATEIFEVKDEPESPDGEDPSCTSQMSY